MDEELVAANQRIDDMSFKDLTDRAAAAIKRKPEETAKTPEKETASKPVGKEIPAKSDKS